MDSMYLDVVDRSGDLRSNDPRVISVPSYNLLTSDIKGAQPRKVPFQGKPVLTGCDDIVGARALPLYPDVKRPIDFSLRSKDIEGAVCHRVEFRTNRCLNPVAPEYDLPEAVHVPPVEFPYSGRPTNKVDDIEGAAPMRLIREKGIPERDPIPYATPNYERKYVSPVPANGLTNTLDVSDINRGDRRVPRVRETNPLNPEYVVPVSNCTSWHYQFSQDVKPPEPAKPDILGVIPGSAPRKLTWNRDAPSRILDSRDIEGTQSQRIVAGQPFNLRMSAAEKPIHDFHQTRDVPGAAHGSLRRGLSTERHTDPLDPRYKLIGGSRRPF